MRSDADKSRPHSRTFVIVYMYMFFFLPISLPFYLYTPNPTHTHTQGKNDTEPITDGDVLGQFTYSTDDSAIQEFTVKDVSRVHFTVENYIEINPA